MWNCDSQVLPVIQFFCVRAIMTRDPIIAYPDETMTEAIKKMYRSKSGRIPVVERDRP